MCCHWATKTPTQTPLATMMCCLSSDWFIVYTLKTEAECNHVLNWNIFIYLFIAIYLPLKYCIDGPMAVVNYRNVKLFLNTGSCVLIDSKRCVFKHCTNIPGSTPFNFSLCIQCAEYIDRNTVYKGMMTTHHKNHLHILNLQLPECIQPKQSLAPPPPQHPPFTAPSLNHSQILCCCQEHAPTFFHDCRLPQYHSIASVISSKGLKYFCHFSSTSNF